MKCAAVLTLNDASEWSPEGRERVAEWLLEQVRLLESPESENLSKTFRARYMYTPGVYDVG